MDQTHGPDPYLVHANTRDSMTLGIVNIGETGPGTAYAPGTPTTLVLPTQLAGSALGQPAQRLRHSVKSVTTGSPIYHDPVDGDTHPELIVMRSPHPLL